MAQQRGAWGWVLLLMVAYAAAVVDRIGIGLLVAPIQRDLGLSDTSLGLIQGLAFGLFYIGLALPLGALVDRRERRWVLIGGILVWSLATGAGGLAASGAALFAARLFVGAGEATITPASASLIADLFPERRRPFAFGIFTAGIAVGMGLSLLFVAQMFAAAPAINAWLAPWGLARADWQLTFLAMALPGLIVVLILLFLREPARTGAEPQAQPPLGEVLRHLASAPAPYAAIIVGTAMIQVNGNVMLAWLPTILIRAHGLTPAQVGTMLAPVALIGVPSALLAGGVIGWLSRRSPLRAPFQALTLMLVFYTAANIAAVLAPTAGLAFAAYAGGAIFSNWTSPAMLSGLSLLTPPRLRGRTVALQMMVIGVLGLGVAPALTGFIADRLFAGPLALGQAAALVVGGAALLGAGLLAAGYRGLATMGDQDRAEVV